MYSFLPLIKNLLYSTLAWQAVLFLPTATISALPSMPGITTQIGLGHLIPALLTTKKSSLTFLHSLMVLIITLFIKTHLSGYTCRKI
jgi:hypothetical protein